MFFQNLMIFPNHIKRMRHLRTHWPGRLICLFQQIEENRLFRKAYPILWYMNQLGRKLPPSHAVLLLFMPRTDPSPIMFDISEILNITLLSLLTSVQASRQIEFQSSLPSMVAETMKRLFMSSFLILCVKTPRRVLLPVSSIDALNCERSIRPKRYMSVFFMTVFKSRTCQGYLLSLGLQSV